MNVYVSVQNAHRAVLLRVRIRVRHVYWTCQKHESRDSLFVSPFRQPYTTLIDVTTYSDADNKEEKITSIIHTCIKTDGNITNIKINITV